MLVILIDCEVTSFVCNQIRLVIINEFIAAAVQLDTPKSYSSGNGAWTFSYSMAIVATLYYPLMFVSVIACDLSYMMSPDYYGPYSWNGGSPNVCPVLRKIEVDVGSLRMPLSHLPSTPC